MNSLIVEPDTTDYWTLSGPGSQVVLCGTVYSNNFALQGPHLGQWTTKHDKTHCPYQSSNSIAVVQCACHALQGKWMHSVRYQLSMLSVTLCYVQCGCWVLQSHSHTNLCAEGQGMRLCSSSSAANLESSMQTNLHYMTMCVCCVCVLNFIWHTRLAQRTRNGLHHSMT